MTQETHQLVETWTCKLHELQKAIRVPKNEVNKFGGFKYRTAEQILEQARAIAPDRVAITLSDDFIFDNDKPIAVKATASILYMNDEYRTTSVALLGTHKGMSPEQATGTAISYARKYALCGLLAIGDGSVDPDEIEQAEQQPKPKQQPKQQQSAEARSEAIKRKALAKFWEKWNETAKDDDVMNVCKELFDKCQNDADKGAVMTAKEEFDAQIEAMRTDEHDDAGDRE